MSLRINDVAPDFSAETTQGPIRFHEWIGDGWAVFFSHPKDFTPVCTTELGAVAALEKQFARRGAKVIGLSVDPVSSHSKWSKDIQDVSGHPVNYPLIGDPELKIAKLYDMLPADAGDTSEGRTPAQNAPVRTVFLIGPDKRIKLTLSYPLKRRETGKLDWRVEKMSLTKDKTQLKYNGFLTLSGIPPEVYEYRLGNRSALEWVIDQYRVSTDKRSGIVNDPNREGDPEYIVRLIGQVVTVSLETVRLVRELSSLPLLPGS